MELNLCAVKYSVHISFLFFFYKQIREYFDNSRLKPSHLINIKKKYCEWTNLLLSTFIQNMFFFVYYIFVVDCIENRMKMNIKRNHIKILKVRINFKLNQWLRHIFFGCLWILQMPLPSQKFWNLSVLYI